MALLLWFEDKVRVHVWFRAFVTGCDHRIDILAWCCQAHKTKAARCMLLP